MSGPPSQTPNLRLAALMALGRNHFLHISISLSNHSTALIAHNQVQQVVNGANDWLRYADNCWIVWTSETPDKWYQKLAAIPELKDSSIFVLKVDLAPSNRSGQFPNWIWEWMNKARN